MWSESELQSSWLTVCYLRWELVVAVSHTVRCLCVPPGTQSGVGSAQTNIMSCSVEVSVECGVLGNSFTTMSSYQSQLIRLPVTLSVIFSLLRFRVVRHRLRLFGVYKTDHVSGTCWKLNVVVRVWERRRRGGEGGGECWLSKSYNPLEWGETHVVWWLMLCVHRDPASPAQPTSPQQPHTNSW